MGYGIGWTTTADFSANGKVNNAAIGDTITFEGFLTEGDGGGITWLKTGGTGTASQLPTVRGDNLLSDANGVLWQPVYGQLCYYNGSDLLFPSPFGDSGTGVYVFASAGWIFFNESTSVSALTTTELINGVNTFTAGHVESTTGFTTSGDGGEGLWVATSTTGLTPSQTPASRVAAEFVDGNGRLWTLVGNKIKAESLGASTLNADNATHFNASFKDNLEVSIGTGVYLTSVFNVGSNIKIKGAGTTIKSVDANAGSILMMNINGKSNVNVSGITFDGNFDNITTFNNTNLVYNSTNVLFEDCHFIDCRGIALFATLGSNVGAVRCTFTDCGIYNLTSGLSADRRQAFACSNVDSAYADYCKFNNIGLDCISFATTCTNVRASHNEIVTNYAGSIYVSTTTGFEIFGNVISNGAAGGNGIDCSNSSGGKVYSNKCYGNGASGVLLANCTNSSVFGNECFNNFQSGTSVHRGGITLSANSGNVDSISVYGNTCYDNQGAGSVTQRYAVGVYTTGGGTYSNVNISKSNNFTGYDASGNPSNVDVVQTADLIYTSEPLTVNTTEDLINSRVFADTVTTLGYSSIGDGGGAMWRKTGNTGTASQSPASTGDLTLFDANGDEWELTPVAGTAQREINIKSLGAEGDASGVYAECAAAVAGITSRGGGVLYFPNGRYGLEQKLVIPKNANISFVGERVSKDSALSANTDGAGVEIYAVNVMDEMFEWNGDASVTAASNLARGLYFRHLHLNGNNKATHTIDCLNIDLLDFYDCRLTGMASGIRILFNGTYTSALLAGGLRVNHCNFGSTSGTHIELDGCTQCWIDGNWFAGTGVSKDFVINRSNKVNIINNEFNNASTCVFELNDSTGNEATQDIIINSNKIALASGTPVIFDDNRTNTSSKRVSFVGNTVVNGATIVPRDLHNPETNTFVYSQTSESKSFVSQSYHEDIHVDDAAGVAKLVNYETAGVTRWRHGANSDAESGSDSGSNYILQRFDDSGSLLSTEMEIDRDTGRMHYSYATATGNGATIDANTGQVTTSSLTVAAGSSVNILFNNPRVNFTPVLVQMRSYSGAGDPIISKVTTGAQTFTITVKNLHASDALNSALNFMFHVL